MGSIEVENISFTSNGHKLKGRIYKPDAKKSPAVAICHGYPGDTKNMDLAEELAFNGYAVLIFYYQGAWGSEGTYRFKNLAPSTVDALKYLKSLSFVDSDRVGLISHSMGAVPLTKVMSEDKSIKTGILMSPVADLGNWLSEDALDNIFNVLIQMAGDKLAYGRKEDYRSDMIDSANKLNPMKNITKIKAPVMVMVGSADTVTVPEDCKRLYDNANDPKHWVMIEEADHRYSDQRRQQQEAVLGWLEKHL